MVIIIATVAAIGAVKGYRRYRKHREVKKAKKEGAVVDDSASTRSVSEASTAPTSSTQRRSARNFTTNRAPEADPPPPYVAEEERPPRFSIVASPKSSIGIQGEVHPALRGSKEGNTREAQPIDANLLNPFTPFRDSTDGGRRASDVSSTGVPVIRINDDGMMEIEVDDEEEEVAREAMAREAADAGGPAAFGDLDSAEATYSLTTDGMRRDEDSSPEPLIPVPERSSLRAASPAISGQS